MNEYPLQPIKFQNYEIEKETELRIQYSEKQSKNLEIKLIEGTAEIFGQELPQNKIIKFKPGSNFFIYTWQGCKIETNYDDPQSSIYKSSDQKTFEHPITIIANTALFLNEMRIKATKEQQLGPRVLIIGPKYCGKSTVSKFLINYSCKQGWEPTLIDLDSSSNEILCGGSIGACTIKYRYPDNFANEKNKILYYTGQTQLNNNQLIYQEYIKNLKNLVFAKLEHDLKNYKATVTNDQKQYQELFSESQKRVFSSGFIINIPYFLEEYRNVIVPFLIEQFDINVILALEDENQYNRLAEQYHPKVNVLICKKFGCLKDHDDRQKYLMNKNDMLLQQYFIGVNEEIHCTNYTISLKKLRLYELVEKEVMGEKKIVAQKWDLTNLEIVKQVIGILHCKLDNQDMEIEEQNEKQLEDEEITKSILNSPLQMLGHIDKIDSFDINNPTVDILLPSNQFQVDYVQNELVKHPFIIGNLSWVGKN